MNQTKIITCLVLFVAAAVAQSWDQQMVDSASSWGFVEMVRGNDGVLWLAYVTPNSNIRVARFDTAWSYEDLPAAALPPNGTDWSTFRQSLALGPEGRPGIAVTGRLAERTDSGWVVESLPMTVMWPRLTYDTQGRAALAFLDDTSVGVAVRETTGWRSLPRLGRDTGYLMGDGVDCLAFRRSGTPMFSYWAGYSMGGMIEWGEWDVFELQGVSWRGIRAGGGVDAGGYAFAILTDTSDSVHIGFSEGGQWIQDRTCYDDDYLDVGTASAAAVLDSLDRPQAVWLASGGIKHGFRTGYWHTGLIPGTTGVQCCDIVLGDDDQPIVAYVAADGSVWVARGAQVVAVEDGPGPVPVGLRASVVRDELVLSGTAAAELLDLSGRRAAQLRPGANDVSGLDAGVYFVRRANEPQTHKIVIAR